MKKIVLLVPIFMLVCIGAWAQQRTIKGRVIESTSNEPLVGATVVVTGTQTGTITDSRGRFSLLLPEGAKSLTISTVGYNTETVTLGSADDYTVTMKTSENSLQQLVVVGYGEQRKADLTGAVATVDVKKTFDSKPLIDVTKALQGIVPGLTITYPDGGLTTSPSILLRGVGSVNGSSAPLILVDNVPTPDLSVINPDDIASITVLKDAASASIYGARAAFGVILIKTKYGHFNSPLRVTYSDNFSWNKPTVLPDFSNPVNSFPAIIAASARAGNTSPELFGLQFSNELTGITAWENAHPNGKAGSAMTEGNSFTDDFTYDSTYNSNGHVNHFYGFWRIWNIKDIMLRKFTPQQTQNLSVSGGTQKVSYYMSFGYNHAGGILKPHPDDVKKYNITAAVDAEATKWLDLSAKVMYRNFNYTYPFAFQQSFYYMWRWPAYMPFGTWTGPDGKQPASYFRGPVGFLNAANNNSVVDNYSRVDLGATLRPVDHLSIEAHYTINRDNVLTHVAGGPAVLWNWWDQAGFPLENTKPTSDYAEYLAGRSLVNSFNGFATYDNTFNQVHHVTLMAGMNAEDDQDIGFSAQARGLLDPSLPELNLTTGATGSQTVGSNHDQSAYAGFFGRANYAYEDKYLVELNIRRDGSSAYSPNERWATFKSGSVGWRISSEPFMNFIKPLFNDLKLRASYGSIGNLDVGGQYYIPTMSSYQANWLVGGTQPISFTNPLAVAKSLSWEKVTTLDFGLDFNLWKNYISGSFDWYQRTTSGMLATNQVPATFGATAPRTNQGDMRDRGFEVDVNFNYPVNKDLKLFAILSLSNDKAVITKWNNPAKVISDYYSGAEYGAIWGFKTAGFFQSAEDVTKSPSQAALQFGNFVYGPGDIKFADLNHDGKIDAGKSTATDHGDLTIIGNTQPQYLYGAQIGGSWKGFDVYIFLQGVGKRNLWGLGDMAIPLYSGAQILYKNQLNYWTPTNTNAFYPLPYAGNSGAPIGGLDRGDNNFYPQSKYLLNLAYCRLKNVTIGYTLPKEWAHKVRMEKLRVYLSGENLTEIDHVGVPLDPEITDGQLGYTGRTFPFERNYSFGVQVTFQ